MKNRVWFCKIGECDGGNLPKGADLPMRMAIKEAYRRITGEEPKFIFSGWGGQLDEVERRVVDNIEDESKSRDPLKSDRREDHRRKEQTELELRKSDWTKKEEPKSNGHSEFCSCSLCHYSPFD